MSDSGVVRGEGGKQEVKSCVHCGREMLSLLRVRNSKYCRRCAAEAKDLGRNICVSRFHNGNRMLPRYAFYPNMPTVTRKVSSYCKLCSPLEAEQSAAKRAARRESARG